MAYMEKKQKLDNIVIEDAHIIFKNFSGVGNDYNKEGDRNFCVVISDQEWANKLSEDGWNVKIRAPREEGDDPFIYIQVAVRFDKYPPKIVMVTNGNKVELNEDTVGELDYADIRSVDLEINPSFWSRNGNSGIKAYLKTMYVTVEEDRFASKYGD